MQHAWHARTVDRHTGTQASYSFARLPIRGLKVGNLGGFTSLTMMMMMIKFPRSTPHARRSKGLARPSPMRRSFHDGLK